MFSLRRSFGIVFLFAWLVSNKQAVAQTPPQPILQIQSPLAAGGYRNPSYDTSNPDWAKNVCGGGTWLSGSSPRYEWMPILQPGTELEDSDVATSGTAINAHPSRDDVWFTHPFGNDVNFDVAPDPEYVNLSAPIRKVDTDPMGRDSSIDKAKNIYGLNVNNVLHVEMDENFVPSGFQVSEGDRVAVLGRWIVDCGHDDYSAEIHPPLLYFAAHPVGANSTRVSIVSRPFLASQEFGNGGLYDHLIQELLKVYPPLTPFPVTSQVEARPRIIQKPFSGIKLFNVVIRPPTPRYGPGDQLLVDYELSVRSGVAVQIYNIGDDAVGVAIVMNDVNYVLATLPKKQNRNVSKKEINAVRPDVGKIIFYLQGVGGTVANPFGSVVLDKGVDTDFYPMPTWVGPPPLRTTVSQLNAVKIQADDVQPWPIRGHIDVHWDPAHRQLPLSALATVLPTEVAIPANVLWVDTGVTLQQGQPFRVEASGTWSNAGPPSVGPDGFGSYTYPGTVLPTAGLGSLIGKVADSIFPVGANFSGVSPKAGRLYLSINDTPDTFTDNQGQLTVKIWK